MSSQRILRETMDKITKSTLKEDGFGTRSIRYVVMIEDTFEEPADYDPPEPVAGTFEGGTFWAGQRGPSPWVSDIGFARLFERESGAKRQATDLNNLLRRRAEKRGQEPSGKAVVRPVEISLM